MVHCERTMTKRTASARTLDMAMPAVLMISSILFAFVHYEILWAKVGLSHKKDFPLDVNTLRGKKKYAQRKICTLRGKVQ